MLDKRGRVPDLQFLLSEPIGEFKNKERDTRVTGPATITNMKISGSEAVMKSLIAEGVDIIFGYPGGAIMPVYNALYDYQDRIKHVLVRHEQGAAHAAEGYSQVAGKAGVCLVTSGPGATNLVTGITDAMIDSNPLVCITGQVHASLIGSDAFQEADVIGITAPITKWNYQITKAEEIPSVFKQAFHIAQTGRPGPVLIDITKNAQIEMLEFNYPKEISIESYSPNYLPNPLQIEKAARLLNESKRPLILTGHGTLISKAETELMEISRQGSIPVASTLLGLSAVPTAFENYVGMLGMHGNYGPNMLTNKADVILAVGMRFDDRVTGNLARYAKAAKIIHIDIDPAEVNKNVKSIIPIVSDAKEALKKLKPLINKRDRKEWFNEFNKFKKIEHDKIIIKETHPQKGEIKMAEVIKLLSDLTSGKSIVVADVGQHQMITARYYEFTKPHSFITSGGLGTMGFALPAGLGAKFGKPHRDVVAVIGDGCFQMNIQELGTIAQENIPVKIIILNNHYLGMVRQWQELFFSHRYSFVNLKNPDFVKISAGYGIEAQQVVERSDLEPKLIKMLQFKGPYLLDISVEQEENVFPMIATGSGVDEIRLE